MFNLQSFLRSACAMLILLLTLVSSRLAGQEIRTTADLNAANKRIQGTGNTNGRVDLLIAIGNYYLNLPGESKQDLSIAMSFRKQAAALAQKLTYPAGIARSIILEGNIRKESGDRSAGDRIFDQAIQFAQKNMLKDELGEAFFAKGQLFGNEGKDLERKIALSENALNQYHASGNKMKEANTLKDLGDFYLVKGDSKHAFKLMDTALVIYKSIGFKELQGLYNNMCINYVQLGDLSKALYYGLQAEKTADELHDNSLQKSSIYNHLGLTYYNLKKDQLALDYWLKAKQIAVKYNDGGYIQTIVANISTILVRMKRPQEAIAQLKDLVKKYPPQDTQTKLRIPYILFSIYYNIQEYQKAEPYYKQLLNFHETLAKDDPNQNYLYIVIIRRLMQYKDFDKLYDYLKEYDKITSERNDHLARANVQRFWFMADSASGKPWAAIDHYKLYKSLTDSVAKGAQNKQIANLEIQYETAKKDKDIALLRQKSALQQTKISQEETLRYVFVFGLVLLALFIALLASRYSLKIRSNKVLKTQQEEINVQNDMLRRLLGEKEWLLKEIHHRVKNNLQIVISLLNTQSAYLDNEDALVAIRNSQNRMHAMSLIHQKLYQSDNLAEIDMNWYIKELVDYMRECFSTDKQIDFIVNTEVIKLDVAQAVPLGLILNEAISNAIKYAFPNHRKGRVTIAFKLVPDDMCELSIADNGVGLPENFDPENSTSLGMSLMTGLSEQLNGEIKMRNAEGLLLEVRFKRHNELIAHAEIIEN
ncbi:tetratricopeptide repeat-containing sensor histidine kinase [Pedobacter duraquae]|nr:histidine kinase dimerization/phosphoacceptor domain -containing protein [Pedobacter duraquae]